MSWYNGDNTFTLVQKWLRTTFYYVTQIYRKVLKLNIHGIIVKYDWGNDAVFLIIYVFSLSG